MKNRTWGRIGASALLLLAFCFAVATAFKTAPSAKTLVANEWARINAECAEDAHSKACRYLDDDKAARK